MGSAWWDLLDIVTTCIARFALASSLVTSSWHRPVEIPVFRPLTALRVVRKSHAVLYMVLRRRSPFHRMKGFQVLIFFLSRFGPQAVENLNFQAVRQFWMNESSEVEYDPFQNPANNPSTIDQNDWFHFSPTGQKSNQSGQTTVKHWTKIVVFTCCRLVTIQKKLGFQKSEQMGKMQTNPGTNNLRKT